jgi:hypothetical protein
MTRFELRVCDVCERRSEPLPSDRHDQEGWTRLDGHDLCPACSFVLEPGLSHAQRKAP